MRYYLLTIFLQMPADDYILAENFKHYVAQYYVLSNYIYNVRRNLLNDVRLTFQETKSPKRPFIFLKYITLKNCLHNLESIIKQLYSLGLHICPEHKVICGKSLFVHKIWISLFKGYQLEVDKLIRGTPYEHC